MTTFTECGKKEKSNFLRRATFSHFKINIVWNDDFHPKLSLFQLLILIWKKNKRRKESKKRQQRNKVSEFLMHEISFSVLLQSLSVYLPLLLYNIQLSSIFFSQGSPYFLANLCLSLRTIPLMPYPFSVCLWCFHCEQGSKKALQFKLLKLLRRRFIKMMKENLCLTLVPFSTSYTVKSEFQWTTEKSVVCSLWCLPERILQD